MTWFHFVSFDLATARVESTCYTALHCSTSHARDRWEFRDLCFVLDQTEAEERMLAPDLPAFFAKDSQLLEFFLFFVLYFFFLATKSQVGGRQRKKLVDNGNLATSNFEHWLW